MTRLATLALLALSGCPKSPAEGPMPSPVPSDAPAVSLFDDLTIGPDGMVPWEEVPRITAPDGFTPHTADPATLADTLTWLQSLRDGEGNLGRIQHGATEEIDMGHIEAGLMVMSRLSPSSFNSQDFRDWTVDDLNSAHALDLAGLDYRSEDLRHLAPLTNLRVLKLTRPQQATGEGLAHLAPLTRLEHLNLSSMPLDAAAIEHLTALTGLRSLHLSESAPPDVLPILGALPQLAYLDIARFSIDGMSDHEYASFKQLVAALPDTRIAGLEHISTDDVAGVVPEGPYTITASLALEPDVPAPSWSRSTDWAHNLTVTLTLTNTGDSSVRLSDLPPSFTNTHNNRFQDGSLLRVVREDGSWEPLETFHFGFHEPAAIIVPERVIIPAGESRDFTLHLAYDAEQELLLAANSSTRVSHEEYGVKVAAGETIRLGVELRQDGALKDTHNQQTDVSHRLAKTDWEGTLRTEPVTIRLGS